MKIKTFLMTMIFLSGFLNAQQSESWNENQLMKTEDLALRISLAQTDDLLILSVGPDALIKGSVDMGAARDAENLEKMRKYLEDVPREKEVVIYCGCCPFSRCPNIRPAFSLLVEMGFKNPKLLDIPQNIRVDWLTKNYPVQE
ncbi:MAG: rhodanese-like domain-containing protein [Flavobacteriia bacterium]|nr:rhodanese-like domain-containing protein [Flavobacteriia bacterium]